MTSVPGKLVCVTGAGGFIASWLVKLLLEKGYTVRGTVRNPDDPKNSHLRDLGGASERLILCRAELNDYGSLREAIDGCDGVFHAASPVTDDPQMVEPAVNGTKNVIRAVAEAKVSRVVLTSSIGAVYMDPNRDPEQVVDDSCWSDLELCKNTKNWYCYGKAVAEQAAWDMAKELGVAGFGDWTVASNYYKCQCSSYIEVFDWLSKDLCELRPGVRACQGCGIGSNTSF